MLIFQKNFSQSKKLAKISRLIPSHSNKKLSFVMEKLKSLKNYLNQATSSSLSGNVISQEETTSLSRQISVKPEESPETPRSVEMREQNTINSRIHKSLNNSTKRITTLLQFRSTSAKTNETSLQIVSNPKRVNPHRPKFLRSTSTASSIKTKRIPISLNSIDAEIFDMPIPCKTDADQFAENLFLGLESILDELIKHFQQTCDETIPSGNSNFMETSDISAQTYLNLTQHAKECFTKCLKLYKKIESNAHKYDFDTQIKSNGYWSILRVFESCASRLLFVLSDLNEKKNTFFFQLKLSSSFLSPNLKDYQAWVLLMEKLEVLLQTAFDMQSLTLKEFENKLDKVENGNNVIRIKGFHEGPSLFVHLNQVKETSIETNLFKLASEHQEAFFGRACGFQFCESLQRPLTGCAIALASYNDGFEAYSTEENTNIQSTVANLTETSAITSTKQTRLTSVNSSPTLTNYSSLSTTLGKAAVSVFSGTKYMMDPESRAKKMSHIMRKANVEFCKAFWQLTETSIAQMGSNLVTPTLAVNVIKKISLASALRLPKVKSSDELINFDNIEPEYVEVQPPSGADSSDMIKIRILSNEMRQGMQDLDKLQTIESPVAFLNQNQPSLAYYASSTNAEPSSNLILHVHGGGFIAHSSKSHEIYLKPWCKELKVPIVSIDYSLAPEHAFPRASEECFYVYAWCLLNKNLLGWTGEKIICVGDSAGGVLVTNIVQRAINSGVRVPDALVPIYAPFLLTYSLSPSRLLSVMDPLLNLGILWRCLAAYSGIDFKTETERYKNILNLDREDQASGASTSSSLKKSVKENSKRFSVRYSKSDSFDRDETSKNVASVSNANDKVEFDVNNENDDSYENSDVFNIAPMSDSPTDEKLFDKEELLRQYEIMGDSIFLIDKLRNHESTYSQYMSPILSDDSVISKFPKTCLIVSIFRLLASLTFNLTLT